MVLPVSAFIICKNEEDYLGPCLESVRDCAEIIVVDSGSEDGTLALIQRYQAQGLPIKLIEEPWRGYGAQKQFALEQCTQPWCLSIDSDERCSAKLIAALPKLIEASSEITGWRFTRYPYLIGWGYPSPKSRDHYMLRLFRNGRAWFDPDDIVHEGLHIKEGRVPKCSEGGLLHFRALPIGEQIIKENNYSSLKAKMKGQRGIRLNKGKLLVSPLVFFVRIYFIYGMWRCGWPGFIHAMTGAVYSFLTEAKRYQDEALKCKPIEEPDSRDETY